MLYGFFGRVSAAPQLRDQLDLSTQRVRGISQRVAGATAQDGSGFALPGEAPGGVAGGVDLEAEMTSLADEQLRFEATAKLLEKTYQKIRLSIRER
jgi:hypothetical protein